MNDGERLLAAVLREPGDDNVRLVYADWLQEHGDEARAEFIRVQVEIAAAPECAVPGYCSDGSGKCRVCERLAELRRRERELLRKTQPGEFHDWSVCRDCLWHAPIPHGGWQWEFRRGFVECVTCAASEWLREGDAILAAHPVRKVVLTTLSIEDRYNLAVKACDAGVPSLAVDAPGCEGCAPEVLKSLWPGVEFELPPAPAIAYGTPVYWNAGGQVAVAGPNDTPIGYVVSTDEVGDGVSVQVQLYPTGGPPVTNAGLYMTDEEQAEFNSLPPG